MTTKITIMAFLGVANFASADEPVLLPEFGIPVSEPEACPPYQLRPTTWADVVLDCF